MKKKIGRNDPCPCGSGKKFKKCCESKMIGKKYMAHRIEKTNTTSNKIASLTTLIPPSVPQAAQEEKETAEADLTKSKSETSLKKTVKKAAKKKTTPKNS